MSVARISAAGLVAATVVAVVAPGAAATANAVNSADQALSVVSLRSAPENPTRAAATRALSPLATMLDQAMSAYDAGDYRRALPAFRGLADQGSAIGETMLGVMYTRGQGIAADRATAAAYWLRAASRGYAPAQLSFARALASGAGVGRDPEAAWVWASLAARGSDVVVAHAASGLATQLQRGFTAAQTAALAKRLAEWRPWIAG